jgi:hypothetical protein
MPETEAQDDLARGRDMQASAPYLAGLRSCQPVASPRPPRPTAPPVRPTEIPTTMQAERRWMIRTDRREEREAGRWTKIPLIATTPYVKASSTKPAMWRSFAEALSAYEPVQYLSELDASLRDLVASVKSQGLEGVVAKRRASRYDPGLPSGVCQKMGVNRGQEFVIGGYTAWLEDVRRPHLRVLRGRQADLRSADHLRIHAGGARPVDE